MDVVMRKKVGYGGMWVLDGWEVGWGVVGCDGGVWGEKRVRVKGGKYGVYGVVWV